MRFKLDRSDVNVTNKKINSDYLSGISLVFSEGTFQQLDIRWSVLTLSKSLKQIWPNSMRVIAH